MNIDSSLNTMEISQVWCFIPVIPVLGRQRQKNCRYEATLFCTVGPCLKKKKIPVVS
jgi:hypothetical protein